MVKNDYQYCSDIPIDATVYAKSADEAIDKVEMIYGKFISTAHRKIVVEEFIITTIS